MPYDFALPEVWPNEPPVYPTYLRGLSYLQLHDGKRAAAEFQKLLDHPGLLGRTVTGALARLQLARAISAYYVDIQERLGGRDDPRLVPLLACLIELLPGLKQWHNDVDPEFGMRMGDYFEGFLQEEARQMGKTLDQITAWEPPKKTARQRKKSAM